MQEDIRRGLGHVTTGSGPGDHSQHPRCGGSLLLRQEWQEVRALNPVSRAVRWPRQDKQTNPVSTRAAVTVLTPAPDGATPKHTWACISRNRVPTLPAPTQGFSEQLLPAPFREDTSARTGVAVDRG